MENIFNKNDYKQIKSKKIALTDLEKQLYFYKNGVSKIKLYAPATINNGIFKFSEKEIQQYATFFDNEKSNWDIEKFVPASGAASRMFKFLLEFLNSFDTTETITTYIERTKNKALSLFLEGFTKFPFYNELLLYTKKLYPDFENQKKEEQYYLLIKTMLTATSFNFANKPKGVLPFHKNKTTITTPFEEHLHEASFYTNVNNKAQIHFTISKEFYPLFKEKANNSIANTSFSYQKETTDTLAVTLNNIPFRENNTTLLFRPGGHGALLENLNALQTDIVFIKNIDNVSLNHIQETILYKKMLGGVLLEKQKQLFSFLAILDGNFTKKNITEIVAFCKTTLSCNFPSNFLDKETTFQKNFLKEILNKPIRVCGMVKNEGEPGGGPFWVVDNKGNQSLQIVESSQIDLTNTQQAAIVKKATHFNPVDIVCGLRNYKKEKFNLLNYRDENTGFIAQKSKNGKTLKSYELPGLWNGAMAHWHTFFVEVPLATFNPVKTINDLLKPAHQPL